jgi:HAD superfamily hydrolase (TIGR01509 family)
MDYDALVFDFDGVIADTEPFYWRAWSELLSEADFELSWIEYCRLGRGVHDEEMIESLQLFVPEIDLKKVSGNWQARRRKRVKELCMLQPPISNQTIDLIQNLRGIRLGLVTSSDRSEVEPILRSAGIYASFHALVFGDDVLRHKPSPDPYLKIAQLLHIQNGVAFEDSASGMESARSAIFFVVHVPDPQELPSAVAQVWQLNETVSASSPRSCVDGG